MKNEFRPNRDAVRAVPARLPNPTQMPMAGWLLLAITIGVFGLVGIAQAMPVSGTPVQACTSAGVPHA